MLSISRWTRWLVSLLAGLGVLLLLLIGLQASGQATALGNWLASRLAKPGAASATDEHAGHEDEHDHAAEEAERLRVVELSLAARKGISLSFKKVRLERFDKKLTVPAILAERSGQSEIEVAAPLTGIVTKVYVIQGESVAPGQPLFDLRITHADLVEAQTTFLGALEQLDVTQREVIRLQKLADQGTLPAQRLLQIKYEEEQLAAKVRVERQALVLHGLTTEQVARIEGERSLLPQMTVYTPQVLSPTPQPADVPTLVAEYLKVTSGGFVRAGSTLCILSDHSELYVQGKGFEYEADLLIAAAKAGRPVEAVFHHPQLGERVVPDLRMLFVASRVEPDSHTINFFLRLPNVPERVREEPPGHKWVDWTYRPGRHLHVRVPVESQENQIVLPAAAVVLEGVEAYVFRRAGLKFERCSAQVTSRDSESVVIAAGGEIQVNDVVVTSGAQALQLALKLQSGGGGGGHSHDH